MRSASFIALLVLSGAARAQGDVLEKALADYSEGRNQRAAIAFYSVAESGAAAENRAKAEYYLAQALNKVGLGFGSFYYNGQIIDAGPSNPYYDKAIEAAVALADQSHDEVFAPNVLNKAYNDQFSRLPAQVLAKIKYSIALLDYRGGKYDEAGQFLRGVPAESSSYPQAQYLSGLLLQRKDPEQAVKIFRSILAVEGSRFPELRELKELTHLALGRTLYGLHRPAEASEQYQQLPRFSRHWDEALFEGAYADLLNGDPGGALGKLHSLHSPHLSDEFAPESLTLTALIYHRHCLYPQAREAIARFHRDYVPMKDRIRSVLESDPPVESYWQMLQPADSRLPLSVQQHLKKNERIDSLTRSLVQLDLEAARVRADAELSKSALGADLLELIARQRELLAQVAGKFIRGRLADMAELIETLDGDKEIIAFETTKGEKEMIEASFNAQGKLASQRLYRPPTPQAGHEYWPFDGEYWPDEIGFYKYTLKNACAPEKEDAPITQEEIGRDAAADRKRDELIEELGVIIPKIAEGERKADLHFQLAELWWEKARYVSLREVKEYDDAYAKWLEKREGEEPRIVTARSDSYRKEALQLYQTILKKYPRYARTDEVLFVVAYNRYEIGAKAEAIESYQTLIARYPASKFVPDAYVQMGEHFFQNNDLGHARDAFEKAASFKLPKLYPFAVYKLAWCDYNAGDYSGAIARFKEVISYSEGEKTSRDRIQLRNEALKDIVLAFAQIDAIETAAVYLREKGGEKALDSINQLAATYFDSGKFEQAIRVYRMLESEAPTHLRAPAWQQKILLAYDKLNKRDTVIAEMKRLVAEYGPNSPWAKANAAEKSALSEGNELAEGALRELVQDYHQEAIKTKSVATYKLARDIYKQYLETFPQSETASQMRFYYAEILYALEEWDAAADAYDKVADADPKGPYAARAAYDAILALEKSVAVAKGKLRKRELAASEKIDERKAKGQVDQNRKLTLQKISKETEEESIPDNEQKLIAACEKYLRTSPGAKDEIVIRYKAAFIHYDHRHFVEAAKRFGDIILRWPTDAWSQKAAELSLDILNTKEEWLALSDLAHKFLQNKKLTPAGGKFERDVARIGEGARFKYVMQVYQEKKDYPLAAKEFKEFVAQYPKSEHAPKALYNALVIADKADEIDLEIAAGEQLIKDHPDADQGIVKLTIPALAYACERAARTRDAIKWYEEAASRWPQDDKAPDWLFNAAFHREELGDDSGALADRQKYLERYGARPDAAKIAFSVGLILERQRDWRKAAEHWSSYQQRWSRAAPAGQLLLARYKQALALRELKEDESSALLADVAHRFGRLAGSERQPALIDAAAHARFLGIEPAFNEFIAIHFNHTRQSELVSALKTKNARLSKLLEQYAELIGIGSPKWSEAAFTRIGEAYRNFNKGLLDAPVPRGLDPEQRELYRSTLESQALPLEDKATEAFNKAIDASLRSGAYSEWTLRAQDYLREYQPDSYGDVHKAALAESSLLREIAPELPKRSGGN
ncbi:MAG: tetratricopeptide repeat protein [Deltaproteobacteria bacterium]|nr:MAG: tetratricopeptide repeat protein [Deltaproteobacteria bacterium]